MEESGTVIFHSAHPLVALRYKDGPLRGVSWGGISFKPDERGVIMVPVEAVGVLTESHGMEGVPEIPVQEAVPEVAAQQPVELVEEVPPGRRRNFGGAVRPTVFPPEGPHPEGGPQPALTETPNEAAVKAGQSEARS